MMSLSVNCVWRFKIGLLCVVFGVCMSSVGAYAQRKIPAQDVIATDKNGANPTNLQTILNRLLPTSTSTDLSTLTASSTELNVLDGFTGTTANLNALVGGGQTALHSHAGSSASLDDAYDNGATITVDNTGGNVVFDLNDATNDNLIVIDAQANGTIDDALKITTDGGASAVFTDAIDVSDDGIVNAINVGANTIAGTTAVINFNSFDVDGSGNVTIGGTLDLGGGASDDLTATDITDLTDGGESSLHSHAGSNASLDDAYNNGQSITVDTGDGLTLTNGASQSLVIDSDTTNSTETNGVLDINVGSTTADVHAVEIALTQDNGAVANAENKGIELTLTGNDADGELVGLDIIGAATLNAATDTYTAGIRIDNAEDSVNSMTDGIIVTSSGTADGVTDGIDVSATNITNAINIGSNNIMTTNAIISSAELDLLDNKTSLVSTLDDAYNGGQSITVDTGDGLTLTNGASQSLVIDSDTTNSTETNGVLDINVGSTTADVHAVEIALTQDNGAVANAENKGIELTLTGNDADGELVGLDIIGAATLNAATDTYTAGIRIDNAEDSVNSMTDGIIVTSSGTADGVTDGIDVSATNITNAINVGANIVAITTGTIGSNDASVIDFLDFDVSADGIVTLASDSTTTTPFTMTLPASFGNDDTSGIFIDGATNGVLRGGLLEIDATYNSTSVTGTLDGVIDLSLAMGGSMNGGQKVTATKLTLSNTGDGVAEGIFMKMASSGSNAAGSYSAGISIDQQDDTVGALTDAILVFSSTGVDAGITDGIDVSDNEITNAINIGDNVILAATGADLDCTAANADCTFTVQNSGAGAGSTVIFDLLTDDVDLRLADASPANNLNGVYYDTTNNKLCVDDDGGTDICTAALTLAMNTLNSKEQHALKTMLPALQKIQEKELLSLLVTVDTQTLKTVIESQTQGPQKRFQRRPSSQREVRFSPWPNDSSPQKYSYLSDQGEAQLIDGALTLKLDPEFVKHIEISDQSPLHVQITPTSPDVRGNLIVTYRGMNPRRRDQAYFVVEDIFQGERMPSQAKFMWLVSAREKENSDIY